jgi:hypothetical protein
MYRGTFDILVEIGGGGSKEDIFVSVEDLISFVVDVVESDGELAAAGDFTGFVVGAMNCFVAEFPHLKVFDPYGGDDGGGPEESGGTKVRSFDLMKVLVLESSPFEAHSTLEELAPPESVLIVDKFMECPGIAADVKGSGTEPCVKAVQKDINQIGPRGMFFTRGAKGTIEFVSPRFPEGMFAAKEMIEILYRMLAVDA